MKSNFSETLKGLRINAGFSQKEVYERFGIRQSTFSAWETGRSEPSADMLLKLCKLYDVNDIFSAFGYDGYNKDGSLQLNTDEIDLVEGYRKLDTHGKEIVKTILKKEVSRTEELQAKQDHIDQLEQRIVTELIHRISIPLYAKFASAGSGAYLFDDIPTDMIAVEDTPAARQADFVIGVGGRSMEPNYYDGEKVFVKKTSDLNIGDIGIFLKGENCYIKELGRDRLISHNPDKKDYPDIIADETITVVGKVLGKVGENI